MKGQFLCWSPPFITVLSSGDSFHYPFICCDIFQQVSSWSSPQGAAFAYCRSSRTLNACSVSAVYTVVLTQCRPYWTALNLTIVIILFRWSCIQWRSAESRSSFDSTPSEFDGGNGRPATVVQLLYDIVMDFIIISLCSKKIIEKPWWRWEMERRRHIKCKTKSRCSPPLS